MKIAFLSLFLFFLHTDSGTEEYDSISDIYHSQAGKDILLDLYYEKLHEIGVGYEMRCIPTTYAETNVVIAGDPSNPPVIMFHGANSGTSIALEPIASIVDNYCVYGIDLPGQPTLSEPKRMPLKNDIPAKWIIEVMEGLEIESSSFVAFSYGGFLLQRLMVYAPEKVDKSVFIVPMGIVNGNLFKIATDILFPMRKYQLTDNRSDLIKYMEAFYSEIEPFDIQHQKAIIDHYKIDLRQPPMVSKKEMEGIDIPVMIIASEDDILFPGDKLVKKSKKIFPNLQKSIVLENAKHIPGEQHYPIIQSAICDFLDQL